MSKGIGLAGLALGVLVFAVAPSSATFPGSNGKILFTANVEKTRGNEIFSANPNGTDIQKLTTSGKKRNSVIADWSPDGQKIAFDSDRVDVDGLEDVVQIYVMNADGSGVAQLTRGPGFHGEPGWAPDGETMAISSDWGGDHSQRGIWIIPASDPSGVTQAEAARVTFVPENADFDAEAQFSPDGSKIVFTRFRSAKETAIHIVNADGTGLERLTPWRLNTSDPDWSPNGKKITFDSGDSGRPGAKGDIYVMRPDGSKRRALTDIPPVERGEDGFNLANNPVWSPNGKKIMFTRFKPENSVIKVMRADGSRQRLVLNRPFANKADWGTSP